MAWFRGNVHAHTTVSDGRLDPDTVAAWYAERGYDWLAITDHHQGMHADEAERLSETHGLLVIPSVEVGGTGHVVGVGVTGSTDRDLYVMDDVCESLQRGVDWIRNESGVPILAHPNWLSSGCETGWGASTLAKIRDCSLFEVHNGALDCNTFAAGG